MSIGAMPDNMRYRVAYLWVMAPMATKKIVFLCEHVMHIFYVMHYIAN